MYIQIATRTAKLFLGALSCLGLFFLTSGVYGAEVSWTNALGGNWSTASNWSTGAVPGASDSVLITTPGSYTVTMDVDATVSSIAVGGMVGSQTLTAADQTLTVTRDGRVGGNGTLVCGTVEGAGELTNEGTLIVRGGTLAVDVINQGTLEVAGGGNIQGAFASGMNSAVQITGSGGTLTFAEGFTNQAVIEAVATGDATIRVVEGKLVNAEGASIRAGGNARLLLEAEVENRGTVICETGSLVINRPGAVHVNSGTIAATGGSVTVTEAGTEGTFRNEGTIDVSGGNSFTVNGEFATAAGSAARITGSGGALTFANGFTNQSAIEATATGNTTIRAMEGTLVNAAEASIRAGGNARLLLEAEVENRGTVICETGSLVINRPGAVHINSGTMTATGGSVRINQSGEEAKFKNEGTINVGVNQNFTVNGGAFENSATGSIEGSGAVDLLGVSFADSGAVSGSVSILQGEGNLVPLVVNPLTDISLATDGRFELDLGTVFEDEDGDTLTFSASSSNKLVATANISARRLIVAPVPTLTGSGSARITVTAEDGNGGIASTSFVAATGLDLGIRADFDGNGTVAFGDFVLFAQAYGSSSAQFDLNGNGTVAFEDFVLFAQAYGEGSATAGAGKLAPDPRMRGRGNAELRLVVLPSGQPHQVDVAVYLDGGRDVQTYQLDVQYDPLTLEWVGATAETRSRLTEEPGARAVALQTSRGPGEVVLADMLQEPVEDGAALARLKFRVLDGAPSGNGRVEVRRALVADEAANIYELAGMRLEGVGAPPAAYGLEQNTPNPFNPTTQIAYQLPEAGEVRLAIYNLLGQEIRTLVQERQEAGRYLVNWNGKDERGFAVSSGVYFYQFMSGGFTQTRRMTLVR